MPVKAKQIAKGDKFETARKHQQVLKWIEAEEIT
jgi:hypothetical protein